MADFDLDKQAALLDLTHKIITGQGPEEEDYGEEKLRQAALEAYKDATHVPMWIKAVIKAAAYRKQLNKDIQERPLQSAAAIPVGAAEGVWDTANMLGEGWSALNHFIDQSEEPTRIDDLLEMSTNAREGVRDKFDDLGLPQSVRTMGEFTGAGGAATKGARKAADTLYDIYRFGL